MKRVKRVFQKMFLLTGIVAIGLNLSAQDSKKDKENARAAEVKALIESRNFVFRPQSVTPMGGRFMQLTPEWDLTLTKDSLISFLPYFGRAFVAPINPTEGGIRFTSTDFSYDVKNRRKGGWDIQMKPEDHKDVRQLLLTATESGYATLQVLSNNKQAIAFHGRIEARAKR